MSISIVSHEPFAQSPCHNFGFHLCQKMKWELVDMGSLNGTLLNSHPVNHPDTGSRRWGDPAELVSGDTITLGTTSKVTVSLGSFLKMKLQHMFLE